VTQRHRLFVAALAACAPPAAPAASALDEGRRATCDATAVENERLVVDWSPLDRSKLEAAARHGVVPVRIDGCRARIVDGCTVRRPYTFAATSRQREVMLLSDRDEVAAKLPVLAVRFGASVVHASTLDVAMTVVGRYESSAAPVGDLSALQCAPSYARMVPPSPTAHTCSAELPHTARNTRPGSVTTLVQPCPS